MLDAPRQHRIDVRLMGLHHRGVQRSLGIQRFGDRVATKKDAVVSDRKQVVVAYHSGCHQKLETSKAYLQPVKK